MIPTNNSSQSSICIRIYITKQHSRNISILLGVDYDWLGRGNIITIAVLPYRRRSVCSFRPVVIRRPGEYLSLTDRVVSSDIAFSSLGRRRKIRISLFRIEVAVFCWPPTYVNIRVVFKPLELPRKCSNRIPRHTNSIVFFFFQSFP